MEAEITAVARHAAFKLKDADRLAPIEHVESRLIIDRQIFHVKIRNMTTDQFLGIADEGQSFQPEKIHLEHAQVAERFHGELGDHLVFLPAGERDNLGKITVADDHARRVDPGIAGQTLEHRGVIPELPRTGLGLDGLLQFRIFLPRQGERDVQLVGNHLGDPVALPVAHAEHPGHVTHHTLGPQLVEGHDLRDAPLPVFLPHVFDDLAAAGLAKVNVDVGRTDPLRIQKALEDEPVAHRVEVCDTKRIGHHASCGRTAPRPDRNRALLGVVDKVPNDKEVAGETEFSITPNS